MDNPSNKTLAAIVNSNLIDVLAQAGDPEELMMALQAQFQLINEVDELLIQEQSLVAQKLASAEEQAKLVAIQKSEVGAMKF